MLLNKQIKVKVNKRTEEWYKEKGYDINTKEIMVFARDLHENCLINVEIVCDYCGLTVSKPYRNYLRQNIQGRINKDCCENCVALKRKESNENYSCFTEQDLNKKEERKNNSLIFRYNKLYGIQLDKEKLIRTYDIVKWWKWFYYGTPNGGKIACLPVEIYSDESDLLKLIKYVLENEIKYNSRNDVIKLKFDILEKYKIVFSHKINIPLYEIINKIYPEYNIKPYELTNVPLHYWEHKENCDEYMNYVLNELKINEIENPKLYIPSIFTYAKIRSLGYSILAYCITNYKHYESFYEWINFLHPEYKLEPIDFKEFRAFDNSKLNSNEEVLVYNLLKQKYNIDIIPTYLKKKYSFYNEKYDENYIPDFIVKTKDKTIIIEYFGLYRENYGNSKILREYYNKTHRKVEFFKSDNYNFIDLYPNDLKDNFEGVRRKLTSFCM